MMAYLLFLFLAFTQGIYFEYALAGTPTGQGFESSQYMGVFSRDECEYHCDGDATCTAYSVTGCIATSSCGGSCYIYTSSNDPFSYSGASKAQYEESWSTTNYIATAEGSDTTGDTQTYQKFYGSCTEYELKGFNTNDYYFVKVAGRPMIKPWCDFSPEGWDAYTFWLNTYHNPSDCSSTTYISSGSTSVTSCTNSRLQDPNMCTQFGVDTWTPRSQYHWQCIYAFSYAHEGNSQSHMSDNVQPYGIIRAYPTTTVGHVGCDTCTGTAMNSNAVNQAKAGASNWENRWQAVDEGIWWLKDSTFGEPNGDYHANCWLGFGGTYTSSMDGFWFNDLNCYYPSGSRYICSTLGDMASCDSSVPPTNGARGDCPEDGTLNHGDSCTPTCNTPYILAGETSCYEGSLTTAVCLSYDYCNDGHTCNSDGDSGAQCVSTSSAYTCTCSVGYEYDGDSRCVPILCSANHHVSNHDCLPCGLGTVRDAGDSAAGGDTSCDAYLCAENEYVSSWACVACAAGYGNAAGDSASGGDTTCDANICTCTSGTAAVAADGSCEVDGAEDCTACDTGYTLNGQVCDAHSCSCTGGTAAVATDGSCEVDGAEDCTACDPGYTLNEQVCDAHTCACTGGTAAVATDGSCEVDGAEDCTACDTGYTLNGQECDADPCNALDLVELADNVGDCVGDLASGESCTQLSTGYMCTASTCFAGTLTPGVCAPYFCTCTGGTAAVATDGSCEVDGVEDCTACDPGYTLNGQVCDAHTCACTGGTVAVATDGSCEVDGAEDCTACDPGYTLNGQVCDAHSCSCAGGTAAIATDGSCNVDGAEDCTACDDGFTLVGNLCDADAAGSSANANANLAGAVGDAMSNPATAAGSTTVVIVLIVIIVLLVLRRKKGKSTVHVTHQHIHLNGEEKSASKSAWSESEESTSSVDHEESAIISLR